MIFFSISQTLASEIFGRNEHSGFHRANQTNSTNKTSLFSAISSEAGEGTSAWIGTNNGFASFDGINWEVFNYSSPQFQFLWVTDLAIDLNNTVWLGSNSYGILSWENNIFTEFIDIPIIFMFYIIFGYFALG